MHSPPHPSDSPHRRPAHDGSQVHVAGSPAQTSPTPAHAVPGAHVPPHPSIGLEPHGRVEGGVQPSAQHAPSRQASPAGHIVPTGHAGHPGGSTGSTPHPSVRRSAQLGQHVPSVHVPPLAQAVPLPQLLQVRPSESTASGMGVPHAKLDADGHEGQQAPSVHVDPASHAVPVPQSRQSVPSAAKTSGTGSPHATVLRPGQLSQQSLAASAVAPGGRTHASTGSSHMRPKPGHVRHAGSGISVPHATVSAVAQSPQQIGIAPTVQLSPAAHPPVPVPVHSRQTFPIASSTSGMSTPHGIDDGGAQSAQHTRSLSALVPGGRMQPSPEGHTVPWSVHSRHAAPVASTASGTGTPHATVVRLAHPGQQLPSMHSAPASQRVPAPVQVIPPMHGGGTGSPHATSDGSRQVERH